MPSRAFISRICSWNIETLNKQLNGGYCCSSPSRMPSICGGKPHVRCLPNSEQTLQMKHTRQRRSELLTAIAVAGWAHHKSRHTNLFKGLNGPRDICHASEAEGSAVRPSVLPNAPFTTLSTQAELSSRAEVGAARMPCGGPHQVPASDGSRVRGTHSRPRDADNYCCLISAWEKRNWSL